MISTFKRNRHFRKVLVNKTFTHVQEQKKAMSPRHSVYIPSSVKSSLKMTSALLKGGIYITLSEFDSVIPLLSQHLLYITFESKKKQFVNYITYGEILKLSY